MKIKNYIIIAIVLLRFLSVQGQTKDPHGSLDSHSTGMPSEKEILKNEAWQMEEQYWKYVQTNDTISYKKLWHEDFIGYPSFGDDVSGKKGIAVWIPKLHENPDQKFNFILYKKAVNPIDGVVMVFYDADEIWKDNQGKVVRKETLKFTHTWKKYGNTWLILGGMAGRK